MKPDDKSWQRLVAAARRAPAPAASGESAPFGFSTRVVALAFEQRPSGVSDFARMSLRAAAIAGILAAVAVAANFSAIKGAFEEDAAVPVADDPIAEVVDLGS